MAKPTHISAGQSKAEELRKVRPKRQDLGDPDAVKERDEWRKLIAQQEQNDVIMLMQLEEGRRFFWRQLRAYRMDENNADIENPNNTFFLLGIRSAGKWLDDELRRVSPENYLLMVQENLGKEIL